MKTFLLDDYTLPQVNVGTGANTGSDQLTNDQMHNWMQCVREQNLQTNASVDAGYKHLIGNIMVNVALRTVQKVVFDVKTKQVVAGRKPFVF